MIPLFSITGCGIYQHSNRTQAMYLPWPSLSPVSHSFVSQQLHSLRPGVIELDIIELNSLVLR